MSNYIVDSADLTSVANAIRTKGGTSAQLAFPADFVQAIEDIETGGGGFTLDDYIEHNISGSLNYTGTNFDRITFDSQKLHDVNLPNLVSVTPNNVGACFARNTTLVSFSAPKLTRIGNSWFSSCTSLSSVNLSALTDTGSDLFHSCTSLVHIALPKAATLYSSTFYGCTALEIADLLATTGFTNNNNFNGCVNLNTLILRKDNGIPRLSNIGNFANSSLGNGGGGCTIYIPKALYDHLGDGSSLDYQAATNWSTIHGYGTITWAQIEGSIYETQYVDGTPIPTA